MNVHVSGSSVERLTVNGTRNSQGAAYEYSFSVENYGLLGTFAFE